MARANRAGATPREGPTVHNEGPTPVTVRIVVRADTTDAESVTLDAGASRAVGTPPTAVVEVHAADGSAAAEANTDPLFVVREGHVLVSPW